jgi:hypothetical protein
VATVEGFVKDKAPDVAEAASAAAKKVSATIRQARGTKSADQGK